MEFRAGHLQALEDTGFGRRDVRLALRPRVAGTARLTATRSARADRHVIPHADQRHDALQLPLVFTRSMQPDDQRIGVIALVMQRSEQRVMQAWLVRGPQQRVFQLQRRVGSVAACAEFRVESIHGMRIVH